MFSWSLPLWAEICVFLAAAAVIGLSGIKAASFADRTADRTGLGEAITGTVFLGFITALPGLVASIEAARNGHGSLAVSNALGGIAVQTAMLAVADLAYRRANLEHAAASATNMMQAAMLILLLVLVIAGMSGPDVTVGHVHPLTPLLIVAAAVAVRLAYKTRTQPMWRPAITRETVPDVPEQSHQLESLGKLLAGLVFFAGVTALAGAVVAQSAGNISDATPIPQVVVGGLFMALATSLPELVTSVAAVRRGALTLAVSDIVGGNFFDVLFIAAADLFFLHGSIYHADGIGPGEIFLASIAILLNTILLAGLIFRQESGPANIGTESLMMLIVYLSGFLVIALAM